MAAKLETLQATAEGIARLAFLAGTVHSEALKTENPARRQWLWEAAEVLAALAGVELGPDTEPAALDLAGPHLRHSRGRRR